MMWVRKILKIYQQGQLPIKYYMIKYLILLKIHSMMNYMTCFIGLQFYLNKKSGTLTETETYYDVIFDTQKLANELHSQLLQM